MKRVAVITIDGEEVDFESMTEKQRTEVVNELNRRALVVLDYQQVKTA